MGVTSLRAFLVALSMVCSLNISAAVLPEDRSDVLYHAYDGGGVTVDGPSVLVRKQFADKVSIWGNYYVDMITSASLDVLTSGSKYTEERTETSAGIDYLHDRTTMSFSYTNSDESDYKASTFGFSISQEFFGDLSSLTMSYSLGNDEIFQNVKDPDTLVKVPHKKGEAEHQRFSIGFSQILTKSWILALNAESVVDEGFLNNPYRQYRFVSGTDDEWRSEKYPTTRNSDAFAVRSMYYLPYRASLRLEYRVFGDSWGIDAENFEIRYLHPYDDRWTFELKYRYYTQSQADFYADIFPVEDSQTFLARDKELSEYSNTLLGIGVNYEFKVGWLPFLDKTSAHLYIDHMTFDYSNYRNATLSQEGAALAGNEPFYSFNANVIRFFISAWY